MGSTVSHEYIISCQSKQEDKTENIRDSDIVYLRGCPNRDTYELRKLRKLNVYIEEYRKIWTKEDLLWMEDIPSKFNTSHKWIKSECSEVKTENNTYTVYHKSTHVNPKTVFYYWNGNIIDCSFDKAIKFFTLIIKSTYHWTSIFTEGKLLLADDIKKYYVWSLKYEPLKSFPVKSPISPRHLIGIFSVHVFKKKKYHKLPFKDLIQPDDNVAIISLRSVPQELVPIDLPKNDPQILWHGAYLLIGRGNVTHVHKWDSEDEGGWLLQSITDIAFPDYVQKEAIGTTKFIKENIETIDRQLNRYFNSNI